MHKDAKHTLSRTTGHGTLSCKASTSAYGSFTGALLLIDKYLPRYLRSGVIIWALNLSESTAVGLGKGMLAGNVDIPGKE